MIPSLTYSATLPTPRPPVPDMTHIAKQGFTAQRALIGHVLSHDRAGRGGLGLRSQRGQVVHAGWHIDGRQGGLAWSAATQQTGAPQAEANQTAGPRPVVTHIRQRPEVVAVRCLNPETMQQACDHKIVLFGSRGPQLCPRQAPRPRCRLCLDAPPGWQLTPPGQPSAPKPGLGATGRFLACATQSARALVSRRWKLLCALPWRFSGRSSAAMRYSSSCQGLSRTTQLT